MVAVSDSSGVVTPENIYTYSAYGEPNTAANTGSSGFPYRYTGRRIDPETGLYYYRARYYDAEMGRFLQVDPIGYNDQMNLYAYVGNDPVINTDPTGMARCHKTLDTVKCDIALDDSDRARNAVQGVAVGLRDIMGKMKEGKMTDSDKAVIDRIGEKFGSKFASEKGLDKLIKGLDGIVKKIGARGEGAVLKQGSTSTTTTKTAVVIPFTNSVYLNDYYFKGGFSDQTRSRTMVHEGAHLDNVFGEKYIRKGLEDVSDEGASFNNADTFACVIYPETCGFSL